MRKKTKLQRLIRASNFPPFTCTYMSCWLKEAMETNGYTHFIFNNGKEILVRRALKGFGELEVEKFSPVERERCLYSSKCYDQARALSFNGKQMLPSQAVVWYATSAFEGQNLSADLKIVVSVESEVCGSCSPWGFGFSSRHTRRVQLLRGLRCWQLARLTNVGGHFWE